MRGLQRMVDEDTYCIDILTQVSAVDEGAAERRRRPARPARAPLRRATLPTDDPGHADDMVGEATRAIERLLRS